ncbi:hypothetical protein PIB19_01970 [Sphingomonas sp. 7/4-4]|uniref:hypothetical protein n=1 Tax=Sphingomonas sp. 7/4-4 TaxID=3018446 RepID=UPI0022F3AB4D|nr:hypothetical protein [Sphingomonas sp. 7/4-4]WBY08318.1 hypothetical protein PIB19_01970 [Sphingomonas sp. 7/4-4]
MAQDREIRRDELYEELSIGLTVKGIPDLLSIGDDRDVLRILLLDASGEKLELIISNVISYRKTEERFMLLCNNYMNNFGVLDKFSVIINNSSMIRWITAESMETIADLKLFHVRLSFKQDILDVIFAGSVDISTRAWAG